jgi:hypothetical protein
MARVAFGVVLGVLGVTLWAVPLDVIVVTVHRAVLAVVLVVPEAVARGVVDLAHAVVDVALGVVAGDAGVLVLLGHDVPSLAGFPVCV